MFLLRSTLLVAYFFMLHSLTTIGAENDAAPAKDQQTDEIQKLKERLEKLEKAVPAMSYMCLRDIGDWFMRTQVRKCIEEMEKEFKEKYRCFPEKVKKALFYYWYHEGEGKIGDVPKLKKFLDMKDWAWAIKVIKKRTGPSNSTDVFPF